MSWTDQLFRFVCDHWFFSLIATVSSLFYGARGWLIQQKNNAKPAGRTNAQFTGLALELMPYGRSVKAVCETEPKEDKLLSFSKLELVHQGWFNLAGAAIGWGAAYSFWTRTGGLRSSYVSWFDALLGLVAVLGTTGHLPETLVGSIQNLAAALKELAARSGKT